MTSDESRARVEGIVRGHEVVIFLKGSRGAPRCGFSARTVDLLDDHLEDYEAVDVLADESLREAVKRHTDWPTFPQVFVRGAFVGGADILQEMADAGELPGVLGVPGPLATVIPEVRVSEAARAAFARYADDARPSVRLEIDREFDATLEIEEARPKDLVIELEGMTLAMDRRTARRADGLVIDFHEGRAATGFRLDNPNAPPKVRSLPVEELAVWRSGGKPHLVIDVRTPGEIATASLEGAVPLDPEALEGLDRARTLVLLCHHGVRSRAAAEHCLRMGFRDVWNLEGGLDAWSTRIDPSVPRY